MVAPKQVRDVKYMLTAETFAMRRKYENDAHALTSYTTVLYPSGQARIENEPETKCLCTGPFLTDGIFCARTLYSTYEDYS